MIEPKIYVGVIDLPIYANFPGEDISLATTTEFKIKVGDTTKTWTATIESATQLKYVTVLDDIDVAGIYYIQTYIVFPSGFNPHSNTFTFRVYDYFE